MGDAVAAEKGMTEGQGFMGKAEDGVSDGVANNFINKELAAGEADMGLVRGAFLLVYPRFADPDRAEQLWYGGRCRDRPRWVRRLQGRQRRQRIRLSLQWYVELSPYRGRT